MNLRVRIVIFLALTGALSLQAEIRLPQLISDGAVLQRETSVRLWGWASPGEAVVLTFNHKKFRTVADGGGNWQILLPPQKAGGPCEMIFRGKNELRVRDILFGDVWVCAGQSNMVLPMERVKEKYPEEITGANYPEIRHFFIPTLTNLQSPREDLPSGNWKAATPENVLRFSATAWFFAKTIYEKYHIPIGLINASVGGTPIEAWISEEGLKQFPELLETVERNKDTAYIRSVVPPRPSGERSGTPGARGSASGGRYSSPGDLGLTDSIKWYDPGYLPVDWHRINVPGYWEDQGIRDLDGVVWYRRDIKVPASMTGVPAKLFMGRIVDADFVWVNGQMVGNITYQYPPRRYELPGGLLKPGKNTIVIRVINYSGKGGFVPDKPYLLTAGGNEIDLKGDWQYRVGEVFEPDGRDGPRFSFQNQPTALYNAMVAPLVNYAIKGFLWYQGESNAGNPAPYERLLQSLILDWRQKWNEGDLPFLYVQLANYMDVDYSPAESKWAELRDAQLQALQLPSTAMAVAIDIGEWNDIHPLDKKDVGVRLALGAMNLAYGEKDLEYSGPIYRSFQVSGDKVILSFDHCGSGMVSCDGEALHRFEIAGPDGKYVWAEARIEGNRVVVWSQNITNPRYVRYAWADNPRGANLCNREGLPASPFRTFNPAKANDQPWQGKKCAVVLTYDDGIDEHLDHAIPALDSMGFHGTFYISGNFRAFQDRMGDWAQAAKNGHELGNHTLFHPCNGKLPGREWVSPDYDLSNYSIQRMTDEIRLNNILLESLDGKTERTFAFTCGDMTIGGEPFIDRVKGDVAAARAVREEMLPMGRIDIYNIPSYMINGESGEQLIELVKRARETGSLLVFLFHGVGGGHSLNVSLSAHSQLLHFLSQHEDEIWITSMIEAVENIKLHQR
jgi:sialate O-acetylesterase